MFTYSIMSQEDFLQLVEPTILDTLGEWESFAHQYNIDEHSSQEIDEFNNNIIYWIKSLTEHKMYCTIGKHVGGINENPHIHVHIVARKVKKYANLGKERSAWYRKNDEAIPPNLTCKRRQVDNLNSVEDTLKYPWKEDMEVALPSSCRKFIYILPPLIKTFMRENAMVIYEAKKTLMRQKQRTKMKETNIVNQVHTILGKQTFSGYGEYKQFIYTAYYDQCESLEDYPAFNELQKAVQKVAIFMKVVPPF